jgi:hypothetical protein
MSSFAMNDSQIFSPTSMPPIASFFFPNAPSRYPFETTYSGSEAFRTLFSLRLVSRRVKQDFDSVVPASLIPYLLNVLGVNPQDIQTAKPGAASRALAILKEAYAMAESSDLDIHYSLNHSLFTRYSSLKSSLLTNPSLKPLLNTYLLQGGTKGTVPTRGKWKLDDNVCDPEWSESVSADVDLFQVRGRDLFVSFGTFA